MVNEMVHESNYHESLIIITKLVMLNHTIHDCTISFLR